MKCIVQLFLSLFLSSQSALAAPNTAVLAGAAYELASGVVFGQVFQVAFGLLEIHPPSDYIDFVNVVSTLEIDVYVLKDSRHSPWFYNFHPSNFITNYITCPNCEHDALASIGFKTETPSIWNDDFELGQEMLQASVRRTNGFISGMRLFARIFGVYIPYFHKPAPKKSGALVVLTPAESSVVMNISPVSQPLIAPSFDPAQGFDLLLEAYRCEKYETVKKLLADGADPNVGFPKGHNHQGWTLTQWAVYYNNTKMLESLFEKYAEPDATFPENDRKYRGWTLTQVAAEQGCLDVLKLLIKNRANLDATFPSADLKYPGWPLTIWAAHLNKFDILKLLIENHANLDATFPSTDPNYPGWGLTQLVAVWDKPQILKLLLENDAAQDTTIPATDPNYPGWSLTQLAISKGWYDILELLINKGVALDTMLLTTDPKYPGCSLTCLAAELGKPKILKLLLEKGALPTAFPETGSKYSRRTLSQVSVLEEWSEILELLINKGADPNAIFPKNHPRYSEWPLIKLARYWENHEIRNLLIAKGADRQKVGQT